jgi:hypothetical protein
MVELAESLPHLKILVAPFAAGAHPGMNGPFAILHFRHPGQAPIVYLENLTGAGVTRRPDDVERYEDAFSDLLTTALDREQSLRLIKKAYKEF